MSAPVDVLADLLKIANDDGDGGVLAMRVRAAVAELIEAAQQAREWIIEAGSRTPTLPNVATLSALNRSLARVGGAS